MIIVCHYGEIALKGKNRKFFEERLVENIKSALRSADFEYEKVARISGRLLIKLKNYSVLDTVNLKNAIANVFGVVNFSFAEQCGQNIESIKKTALKILKEKNASISDDRPKLKHFWTFKVDAKRAEKNFSMTSQEINEQVGEYILNKIKNQKSKIKNTNQKSKIKVDLENPDVTIFIEVVEKYAFVYAEKIPGPGGLPVGVSGRAVTLLSGGIDSPVASCLAMKRGLELIFIHFHSIPYADKASIEKVKKIIGIFKKFQTKQKLYLVPFTDIQKEIFLKTSAKLRIILYRRMMLRIAEEIAQKENCQAIVTGDNLGQVASQTLDNMAAIEKATTLPVLRPLVCFDKQEIIEKAKKIGAYEISILPHDDCCARFLPRYPEIKAKLNEVKQTEKKLKIALAIKNALKKAEYLVF